MLVLLPPSETKAPGGSGAVLDVDQLYAPELNPVRNKILDALGELARDVPASLAALKLSATQSAEVTRNQSLRTAATMPALARYTGVLYDALDQHSFTPTESARANSRLLLASALFGFVRPYDLIPAYRLSGNSVLPALGPLRGLWRPAMESVCAGLTELVVDLRSSSYVALAPIPNAITVRVVTENAAGQRTVVSHHNKAYKGRLARVLSISRAEPATLKALINTASKAGLAVEQTEERTLELITNP